MRYETKKAILEAYGKAWKNVRRLDKAIKRGFIVERNGMYAFKSEAEKVDISWLKEENERLRKEVEGLKKNEWEDLKDHLKFFYEMDLQRKAAMNIIVQSIYNKNQAAWWDAAVEKANSLMKFEPNPDEDAEVEYVGGLLS
jgi:predicted transcriptional regulator